jgi:uncharacterized protein
MLVYSKKLFVILSLSIMALLSTSVQADELADARSAYEHGEFASAQNRFLPLAKKGDALAEFYLGLIHENGQGVAQNYKKAGEWYQKAANHGIAVAQNNLAMMYSQGKGLPQDHKQALKWFSKAAAQGSASAQLNIGIMYADGLGVYQNSLDAYIWATIATVHGDANSKILQDHMAKQLTADNIVLAYYDIGIMFAAGHDIPKNNQESIKWYTKAAKQGHVKSQEALAALYLGGEQAPQDFKKAAKWVQQIAKQQGDANFQKILGIFYREGLGVNKDYKKAAKWFQKSAKQGNTLAQTFLGLMYREGQGVTKDQVHALMWFNLSAADGDKNAENLRNMLAKTMSPAKIDQAQKLTEGWKPAR